MTDRRLIEEAFPLKEIGTESAREKSARQGNPSGLHYWWARKPLAASRAAILASVLPSPRDDGDHDDLLRLLVDASKWDYQRSRSSQDALNALLSRVPRNGTRRIALLDPFAGSGSIPLEATRVGLRTYSSDLNPVASILQRNLTVFSQRYGGIPAPVQRPRGDQDLASEAVWGYQDEVCHWASEVYRRAKEQLNGCYPTEDDEEIVAYLWCRTLPCGNPACRATVPLYANSWLEKHGTDKGAALRLHTDATAKTFRFEVVVSQKFGFDPSEGTLSRGKLQCPFCGEITASKTLRQSASSRGEHLMCVATVRDDGAAGKVFRLPTNRDREGMAHARQLAESQAGETMGSSPAVPHEPLPPRGTLGFRVTNYGMTVWGELFTERQTAALLTFARIVRESHQERLAEYRGTDSADPDGFADAITTVLATMVSRLAANMSRQCTWLAVDGSRTSNPFGTISIPMVWDFSETNPLNGQSANWQLVQDATLAVIKLLPRENPAEVLQTSADSLPHADGEIDVIVTDPPYYDAVPYSDISDYFYIWQKRMLDGIYPDLFSTMLTPKRSEVVENPGHGKDALSFERAISKCFVEMARVLSKDGIATIIFAHKSTVAWEHLLASVLAAGFVVTASWPVETEKRGRPRALDSAALASSVFLVCRKRSSNLDGFLDDVEPELRARLHERLDYFWSQGIRGADFFMSAIGPAVEVFGKHKRVLKLSGDEVTIGELLDRVRGIVADYALQRIVHGEAAGNVDEESRFYVIWRWAFGTSDVESGEAIHMAQSMGCEFDALVADKGVLNNKGDKVSLKGPTDRTKIKGLGEPAATGTLAPLIDVLHRAANLWAAGQRQELADFLTEALPSGGIDRMQRLGQSIVDVLVPGDKERALYENFLVGARSLPAPTKKDEMTTKQQKLF